MTAVNTSSFYCVCNFLSFHFPLTVLSGRPHVKENFLSDLRKTREQLKGQPDEMTKVNKFSVVG